MAVPALSFCVVLWYHGTIDACLFPIFCIGINKGLQEEVQSTTVLHTMDRRASISVVWICGSGIEDKRFSFFQNSIIQYIQEQQRCTLLLNQFEGWHRGSGIQTAQRVDVTNLRSLRVQKFKFLT